MSQEQKFLDINQAFENLLFAEDLAQKSAYEEGFAAGKEQLMKGYHLGFHRASVLAAQLGYYSGVLEHYLESNKDASKKVTSLAEDLLKDIRAFPARNDENVDILKAVEDIKFKYAKFCSLAKIVPLYPEAEKLDF